MEDDVIINTIEEVTDVTINSPMEVTNVTINVIDPSTKEKVAKVDRVDNFTFIGSARYGSAVDSSVWNVYRIESNVDGSSEMSFAENIKWTDRLTEIYS